MDRCQGLIIKQLGKVFPPCWAITKRQKDSPRTSTVLRMLVSDVSHWLSELEWGPECTNKSIPHILQKYRCTKSNSSTEAKKDGKSLSAGVCCHLTRGHPGSVHSSHLLLSPWALSGGEGNSRMWRLSVGCLPVHFLSPTWMLVVEIEEEEEKKNKRSEDHC